MTDKTGSYFDAPAMIGRPLDLGEILASLDSIVYQVFRGNIVCVHDECQLERQQSNTLAHI